MTEKNFKDSGTAFDIGEDFARYGLPCPQDPPDFQQGYDYQLTQKRDPLPADRFVRKWLQLRKNAWKRNRYFDPEVTPAFLKHIDRPTCLISGVTLTYATGQDTDWSIDRVDNEGAYTRLNIALVSTRVNKIKGALSLDEIVGHTGRQETSLGLNAHEWLRLLRLVLCANVACLGLPIREVFSPKENPNHLAIPWCCALQEMMVESTRNTRAKSDNLWRILKKDTPTKDHKLLANIRQLVVSNTRMVYAKHRTAANTFDDPVLFDSFTLWWNRLADAGTLEALTKHIAAMLQDSRLVSIDEVATINKSAMHGYI